MINTIFYFVDDETFDYNTALQQETISPYTIVFNKFDKTIKMGGVSYGQMNRTDVVASLGNISDILPVATNVALGAIKIGYTSNVGAQNRNYGVQLDENNRAFVSVPWTDTITPEYDDSALRGDIATERQRIDTFIQNLDASIQEKVEDLLDDAQWVEENFTEGQVGGQSTNTTEELLKTYGVWNWKDSNDHSKGKDYNITKLQASVLGLQGSVGNLSDNMAVLGTLEIKVNGEYTLTTEAAGTDTSGAVDISTISEEIAGLDSVANGDKFRTSQFDTLPASNAIYKKGSTYFHFVKSDGVIDSVTNLTDSISQYDPNFDKLVKMAASTLGLKTSKNGNLLTTMADLSSVITTTPDQDGKYFTGYSGLSTTVEELSDGMSAHSSLLSTITKSTDPDNADYGKLSDDLMAGIASSAEISGAISTAQTNLISSINNKTAGINVMVTKNATTGAVDSGITLSADQVIIDANQTSFKSAVGAFVKTDVLEAGNATFNGTLSGVDGTFTGTLSGANGSFTGMVTATSGSFKGNVNATQFVAGDEAGLNVTVTGNAISFNHGSEQRAWFTTLDENGNDTDGMFLYIKNPDQTATNKVITIDFTNLTFKPVGTNQQSAVQQTDIYNSITGSNVRYASSIFKGSVDGLYYSDSQLTTLLTGTINTIYYQYIKEYFTILSDNSTNRLYRVKVYKQVTFSQGVKSDTSTYKAILYDTNGNTYNGYVAIGSSSAGTINNAIDTIKMGSGSDSIYTVSLGHLSFESTDISSYVAKVSGGSDGKISLYESENNVLVKKQDLTINS